MILFQDKLPSDILIFINTFICKKLNDNNIKDIIKLWFEDKEKCISLYGHISHWKTSNITDMSFLFYDRKDFNEDLSNWDVKKNEINVP